jgi:hypothetical protein
LRHISRGGEGCSDVNKARERAENPPFFKKLANAKSVQAEAMDAVIAQKKMRDQRAQLRELIRWQGGKDEGDNLRAQEKQKREKRQKLIHDRIVVKQKKFDSTTGVAGILARLGIIIGIIRIIPSGG